MPTPRDIKRVMLLPLNYDHQQWGMISAFTQVFGKHNVDVFDYLTAKKGLQDSDARVNAAFLERAEAFKPDWVWMQLQETQVITADTISGVKKLLPNCVITQWNGDYRPVLGAYQRDIAQVCDISFVSSRGQLVDYHRAGASDVSYCQIGLDWAEDVLGLPEWLPPFIVPDVVFIGNYYADGPWKRGTQERLDAVLALKTAFGPRFGVVGQGWPTGVPVVGTCTVKQQHHVYKRAKVAINVNHENHVESYYSDRLLIAMASGTPVVSRYVPGLDEEFDPGQDLLVYADVYADDDHSGLRDLCKQVQFLLDTPDEAKRIGARARAWVMTYHSWYARVLQVLPEIVGIA